ncbi:MAG TPA: rod shape-determining protein MreC [bacterium]|nr:rod shape-determining protein MreC [bacterium]
MRKIPQPIDKPLSRRQNIFYFVIILFTVIIIILFNQPIINLFNNTFSFVNQPYSTIFRGIIQVVDNLQKINELYSENNQLKEENIKLTQQNIDLQQLNTENAQLKTIINYYDNNPEEKFVTAKIYARDPLNISDTISINKGAKDSISVNNHVSYDGVYIGQVVETNDHSSKIRLITDPAQAIVCQIPSINVSGITTGQIGYGLIMDDIPPDANLKVGQIVTTSSIDNNLPSNLLVGEITEIKKSDQQIFQQAYIKPYFNIYDLKFVSVYTP